MDIEKVILPGLPPKRAADFKLNAHNGVPFEPPRYARVVYIPQESLPDRVVIEAQAFEVDAQGNLRSNPKTGAASRTSGTRHTISLSGVGDTHTVQPGWTRVVGNYSEVADQSMGMLPVPEDAIRIEAGASLPPTGTDGAQAWKDGTLYRWSRGMVEDVMYGKAADLAGLLFNSNAVADFEI